MRSVKHYLVPVSSYKCHRPHCETDLDGACVNLPSFSPLFGHWTLLNFYGYCMGCAIN